MDMEKVALVAVLFLTFILIASPVSSFSDSPSYRGGVSFELKEEYRAGEVLQTEITVANFEGFPLADGRLVVDLVQGCEEPVYPSQNSDCDSIFYEEIIRGVSLPAKGEKKINFSYRLPENLKGGTYRMDIYLMTGRTPVVGIPFIHLPGKHHSFTVTGDGKARPKILRTETNLEGQPGPVGPGVKPGEEVTGEVFIEAEESEEAVLWVKVCSWDDTSCDGFDVEKSYPVSLTEGQNRVNFSFTAQEKPDAYAVRFELRKDSGGLLSLYRSRVIVQGKTAKIRKLAVSEPYFREGEGGEIYLLAGASPDHYTNPVVENVRARVEVRKNGEIVFEDSKDIDELSNQEGKIFRGLTFGFSAPEELKDFQVCGYLESSGKRYDDYCFTVDTRQLVSGVNYRVDYTYREGKLDVEVCAEDDSGIPLDREAEVLLLEEETVREREGKIEGCKEFSLGKISPGGYTLLVTDRETGKQFPFRLVLEEEEEKEQEERPASVPENPIPVTVVAVVVLVLIAVVGVYFYRKKGRGEE